MMPDLRVLVITGAGISAESGIPTFRGANGYWRNLDPAKLATPEAFARDPKLVWEWYRQRRQKIRAALPNPAHGAIVKLARNCGNFLLITQNVDDLHARAEWNGHQLSLDEIVRIHGDIFLTRCSHCSFRYSEREETSSAPPSCTKCGELMRPGVVWFGEQLDPEQVQRVEDYIESGRCDVVLLVGTTAMFGYIMDWASRASRDGGQMIEINPEATALSPFATQSIRKPAGVVLPSLVEEILAAAQPQ